MDNRKNTHCNDKNKDWFYVKTLYKILLKLFANCYMIFKVLKTVWKMLKIMLKTHTQKVRIIAMKCIKKIKFNKTNRVLTKGVKN